MEKTINNVLDTHIEGMKSLKENGYIEDLKNVIEIQLESLNNGGKILIAGNGGSASDAQHFAGELVGRFLLEREGIPAIALNTDTSVMTCLGNDYGYDSIFARQIEAIGNEGDVFIGISTSGNSKNIIEAVEMAHKKGITTIGFLGKDGGILKNMCDANLIIPFKSTARVQEAHIMSIHIICEIIEEIMAEKQKSKSKSIKK